MDLFTVYPTWSSELLGNFLESLLFNSGAVASGPLLHLFVSGPGVITPEWDASDFVEVAFAGYSTWALPVSPTVPVVNLSSGQGQGAILKKRWTVNTAPAPPGISVLGYWIDDPSLGNVIAERFTEPAVLTQKHDYVNLTLVLPLAYSVSV